MTIAEFCEFVEKLKRDGSIDEVLASSSPLVYHGLTKENVSSVDLPSATARVSQETNHVVIAKLYEKMG